MFEALAREADMEWLMIDFTIVRAHQHAAGARRKKGGACPGPWPLPRWFEHENPCRWRRLGNPVRLIGWPGQGNDITHAHELDRRLRRLTPRSPTKATTPITCTTRLPKAAARSSSRPSATAKSSVPTTPISTKSATSSSASSTSSNSSAASRPDTTSSSPTSWASSNSPLSPSGSDS